MGYVWRPNYRPKLGRDPATGRWVYGDPRPSPVWHYAYRDARGKEVRRAGFPDKRLTEQLLARCEREVMEELAGVRRPADARAGAPLAALAGDYAAHLRDKGDTEEHVRAVSQRLREFLADPRVRARVAADLDGGRAEAYLARRRALGTRAKGGFGAQTSNHHRTTLKAFAAWLAAEGLLDRNPLLKLSAANVAPDRRHVRRVLAPDELERLLRVTRGSGRAGWSAGWMGGPDRAVLYEVAAFTGLRASELSTLAPGSFDLAAKPPTVRLAAAEEKNRKGATLPVPDELAARLRPWLARRPKSGPCWPGPWAAQKRAGKILRHDLAEAGIAYRDERGRVFDFHALRSQFATALVKAGTHVALTQKLMRHSTPVLTLRHYVGLEVEDLAEAVNKLTPPAAKPAAKGRKGA